MKTAMQQLVDFLEPEIKMHDFLQLPAYEMAKTLLEVEKQQIIDANRSGVDMIVDKKNWITGEQYYKFKFRDQ